MGQEQGEGAGMKSKGKARGRGRNEEQGEGLASRAGLTALVDFRDKGGNEAKRKSKKNTQTSVNASLERGRGW